MNATDIQTTITAQVGNADFAFVRAPQFGAVLEQAGLRDWAGFAHSWDDLGVDSYIADGG
jgi:hypothetical protein